MCMALSRDQVTSALWEADMHIGQMMNQTFCVCVGGVNAMVKSSLFMSKELFSFRSYYPSH